MKQNIHDVVLFVIVLLIITTVVLVGCNSDKKTGDTIGAGPTVEDMNNTPIDEEETINEAILTCEKIMAEVEKLPEVESAVVYINHESVLVALKLQDEYENVPFTLRNAIEIKVKDIYSKAKTIAISGDEYVYKSISKLLKSFKEDKPVEEFKKDLEEIIKQM